MRILALETAVEAGSIALAEGLRLLAEEWLPSRPRSAQTLAPAVQRIVAGVGWRVKDIALVAVTIGPGSFTGLRVGVATAKTLAYALGARCVGFNTLEVIAAQAPTLYPALSVVLDAQRGEVFAAEFEPENSEAPSGSWRMVSGPALVDGETWLSRLASGTAVSGPGLGKLRDRLPTGVTVVDPQQWSPRAATVAELAWRRHLFGDYDDVWKLAPLYLRKSAAEEKWERGTRIED